jgi:DNA-binding NarL/FixJ family response regulator
MFDVLLVEDQPLVSEAASYKISLNPRVTGITICNTTEKALRALRPMHDRWDLIFLDLGVPGAVGLSLAMELHRLGKAPITCILTGERRSDYIAQIAASGFLGYILKAEEIKDLLRDMNRVIAGETVFPSDDPSNVDEPVPRLTARQRECLHLVSRGKTTKQIAQMLGLHPGTINSHIDCAMATFGVNSRAHAVQLALQYGLVSVCAGGRS